MTTRRGRGQLGHRRARARGDRRPPRCARRRAPARRGTTTCARAIVPLCVRSRSSWKSTTAAVVAEVQSSSTRARGRSRAPAGCARAGGRRAPLATPGPRSRYIGIVPYRTRPSPWRRSTSATGPRVTVSPSSRRRVMVPGGRGGRLGGVGEAERPVDVLAGDEVAALDGGGVERHGVVGGAGAARPSPGANSSQATTATPASTAAARTPRAPRRAIRRRPPVGRRRSLRLLRARAGALAVAEQVVAHLVGGLEPRRFGADAEAVAAAAVALAVRPGPAWKVSPPLPGSFGSGMSTPCPRMQRANFSAASRSLARLAGSMVSPPPICMYFWQALCADFIFGSLKCTLAARELDARRLPTRCGSGMSMPCSRMHLANFRAPSKALSCRLAPLAGLPPSSELPQAPSASAAPTAARRSGDLVMAGHEARPT